MPVNKHRVGKGCAVNRNEGLHPVLRGKLNLIVRRTKIWATLIRMEC